MLSPSQGYSTGFIRFWILCGLIVFTGMIASPYILKRAVESEKIRFEACQKNLRQDCLPSFTWVRNGWEVRDYSKLGQNAIIPTNLNATSTEETGEKRQFDLGSTDQTVRVVATSRDKAPTIVSVKPQGMTLVSHRYLADPGTTVKVVAQIAKAASVEMWIISRDASATPFPVRIGAMKKSADETYEAEFKVAEGLLGEIEIRAQGIEKNENASMFVNIAATTKE